MPETNVERLSLIIEILSDMDKAHSDNAFASLDVDLYELYKNGQIQFLSEQAERVQELETIEAGQMVVIGGLRNKNKRLREALSDIIECSDIPTAVEELAHQALKGGVQNDKTHKT